MGHQSPQPPGLQIIPLGFQLRESSPILRGSIPAHVLLLAFIQHQLRHGEQRSTRAYEHKQSKLPVPLRQPRTAVHLPEPRHVHELYSGLEAQGQAPLDHPVPLRLHVPPSTVAIRLPVC